MAAILEVVGLGTLRERDYDYVYQLSYLYVYTCTLRTCVCLSSLLYVVSVLSGTSTLLTYVRSIYH